MKADDAADAAENPTTDAPTEAPPADGGGGSRLPVQLLAPLEGVIEDLTPGQRWTSALMLTVAVMVVAFGLPADTIINRSDAAASPADRQSTRPADTVVAGDSPAPTVFGGSSPLPFASPSPRSPLPAAPRPGPGPIVQPPVRPEIVALVRAGGGLPGRDDASIAAAFLDNARFDATVIELTDDDGLCAQVAGAGQVVIASHGLPGHLRDCLVESGLMIIAHDALGTLPPFVGSGEVVSTRRGHRASLGDLARWALATGALDATPGLVVSTEYRVEVDEAIDDLAALGIEFAAVHYVPPAPERDPAIVEGVRAFTAAGVETVLFAADVDDQARWVEVQALAGTAVSYVVSDVGNAIVEESYPPFFAAAKAHTSLRFPWQERTEAGATPEQEKCRAHWEGAAPPAPPPTASEIFLAYLWCQHAWLMVEPALDAVDAGVPFAEAIRSMVVPSPATSELGPIGPFRVFGPRLDVALGWNGGCSCWVPDAGFTPR